MRKSFLLTVFLALICVSSPFAQSFRLSPESRISLLTCGPGESMYSFFGHSALLVQDPVMKVNRVYNYGTFDFSVPNFYWQFVKGKLYYMLSITRLEGFITEYISENRSVKKLLLNLNPDERQELFNLLEINYQPENRHYWYDFFLDNCSTRIRDIVTKATASVYQWPPEPSENLTFRDLILPYIKPHPWAATGILLLLAHGADATATQSDYMFLPDHMDRLFAAARTINGQPLGYNEQNLFIPEPEKATAHPLGHPYTVLGLFLVISVVLALYKKVPALLAKSWFSLLFFLAGLTGILLSFMWFFSAHKVCHGNLNLAWAFPVHIFMAGTLWFPGLKMINQRYSRIMMLLICLFLITFPFWKQSVPLEGILMAVAILAGFYRFSGFDLAKPKPKNQTN